MHAIIRQGNGKYYVSAVFGYYTDAQELGNSQDRYGSYWIVWNDKKERLIRVYSTKNLPDPVVIVDCEQSNWNTDEHDEGCVNFLDRILLDSFLDAEHQPEYILEACREMDMGYEYAEIREILTQKDIDDLRYTTNGFCDAYVIKEKLLDNDTLYLLFDGLDGYQVEVWFSGNLEYDTSRMDVGCTTWCDSTLILNGGFVYFADWYDLTIDNITKEPNYFKARHMKYRIIPD